MTTGQIILIEVKSQSTDVIPIIFSFFYDEYKKHIDFYILFNEQLFKTRRFSDTSIHVILYIFPGILR